MPGGAHILRNGAEVKEGKGRAPSRQSSELHEPIQPGAALVAAAGLPAEPSRRDAGLPVPRRRRADEAAGPGGLGLRRTARLHAPAATELLHGRQAPDAPQPLIDFNLKLNLNLNPSQFFSILHHPPLPFFPSSFLLACLSSPFPSLLCLLLPSYGASD